MHDDNELDPLQRIQANKDFPQVEAICHYLRAQKPRLVTSGELCTAVGQTKKRIYGLIKIARRYLELTSGEFMPNQRNVGYTITGHARAALFESIKAGNRADGHLAAESRIFQRLSLEQIADDRDRELYCAQQTRIVLGNARREMTERMRPLMIRNPENLRLTSKIRTRRATELCARLPIHSGYL